MSHEIPRTSWLAVLGATLAGFGMLLTPMEQTEFVRIAIRDTARPGLESLELVRGTVMSKVSRWQLRDASPNAQEEIAAKLEGWKQRCRELEALNVLLAGQLADARSRNPPPLLAEAGAPLFIPEMIEASIIGAADLQQATQRISYRRILDVGLGQDVIPSDYVVNAVSSTASPATLQIDQGLDQGLHADQPVFAGRCIVGKVGQSGRWTSTVIPVTDEEFRGSAQLMRKTAQGPVPGAEGVIAGDGKGGCLLQYIPATEPVAAGDHVFANVRLPGQSIPMYYGPVIDAMLTPGASHWTIRVQPAESLAGARAVQVLRSVLNTARTTPGEPSEGHP